MNARDRREIRQVRIRAQAGDRQTVVAMLRALEAPPAPRSSSHGQLMLAFVRSLTFRCAALDVERMQIGTCIDRQRITEAQRTEQSSRGQGTDYPHCDSLRCAQGRTLREMVDPTDVQWRGQGPGGRFAKDRYTGRDANRARERLRVVGLLDEVRILDLHPDPVEK